MALKHASFECGTLAYSSVGATYTTILSLTDDSDVLYIFNSLNQPVTISVNGGTTDHFYLPPLTSFTYDGRTNMRRVAKGIVKVKYSGSAPTAGLISVTSCKI